ncbi:MAG: two-component regulator propeller domain-containing protein [Bacteroidales bacterium]
MRSLSFESISSSAGKLILLTFLIFFKLNSPLLYSQSYELRIQKIIDEKDLDPGATFAIAEDATGFLWFGTVDGLYRFDGFNYKVYRNEKNNPNSLSWNTIRALCITKDNKLWIGTQGGGLDCFDINSEKFTHYPFDKNNKQGISGEDIWSLYPDSNGNIWIGVVGSGIDMLDRKSNTFKHFKILPPETKTNGSLTIRAIYKDSEGFIWVGIVGFGLTRLNPDNGQIVNFRNNPNDPESYGSNDVYGIYEDRNKNLIVCAYAGGLNFYNRKTGKFTKYFMKNNKSGTPVTDLTMQVIEDNSGEYWIGSEFGLSVFNKGKNQVTNFHHEKNSLNTISDDRIRSVFMDSRGIIWIGSEAGVDKIVKQRNFKIYKNNPGNPFSLPAGIVRSIAEDSDGYIWVGLIDNGLVRYNAKMDGTTLFKHQQQSLNGLSGNNITAIFQDTRGVLWCGEWDTGLNKFNKQNETFTLFAGTSGTKARLTDTRIQFIKEAKPGVLWIGTEYGINRLDLNAETCTYFLHQPDNNNSLSSNSVQSNAFVQDKNGNLWVGTWSGGLNFIEFKDKNQQQAKFTHYKTDPQNYNSINNNNVISLLLDGDILWIGTFGGGLNKLNIKTGVFKHYTTENGLVNNIIFAILQDNEKNLWLSTDRGLSKFNPENESFINYTKNDGLQDDHFFWGAACKSRSGELFFGGINGMNSFLPNEIIKNSRPPVPVMLDIKIFEKSIDPGMPIAQINQLEIPFHKNYITFEYTGLDYIEPSRLQYMIKMDGLDEDWHFVGNRRFTSYSSLDPKEYTFRLKVANKDGVWNNKELAIKVIVNPPWYRTWYAITIFSIFILGSFLGFYFIRIRLLTLQKKKLEELVHKRTSIIMEQKTELQEVNDNLKLQKEELSQTLDELKKAQNQLIESEKMASLGILTAGIAHEINNPLNYIQAGIYGIESSFEDNIKSKLLIDTREEFGTLIESIKIGVYRVSDIVNSLNHFSRQTENKSEKCNIHAILDQCLLILNHKYKDRIEIKKNFTQDLTFVEGNEGKLHQVFLNIIGNAVQAIQGKGEISITTRIDNNLVYIIIIDNGSGIDEEILHRVYDPFFTTKEPGSGTGLGLSISYGIIKDHNGNIEIKSKTGMGTEVIVSLKLYLN